MTREFNPHRSERHCPARAGLPFGFSADGRCVPSVEFDFETVFQSLDCEVSQVEHRPDSPPLLQVLSPRELQHAYAIASSILKKSSPRARASRASWRDPVSRQRRLVAIARAAQNPEVRRKRSEHLRRYWQRLDPQRRRDFMMKIWRGQDGKWLANLRVALRDPEYRRGNTARIRARWADPVFKQKVLAIFRSPEARLRASLATRRYFQQHPEARLRAAERLRALWRVPAYRKRFIRNLKQFKGC